MIRDNTGRFAERPFYQARELDDECERLIRDLLLKRHGKVDYTDRAGEEPWDGGLVSSLSFP
jgi:hypothetical protein